MKVISIFILALCFTCSQMAMAWKVGEFYVSFRGTEPSVKTYCFDSSATLDPNSLSILWKVLDLRGYRLVDPNTAAYRVLIKKADDFSSFKEIVFLDNKREAMPPILTIKYSGSIYTLSLPNPEYTGLYLFWGSESVKLRLTGNRGGCSKIKMGRWGADSKFTEEFDVQKWNEAEELIMGKNYYDDYYAACIDASNQNIEDKAGVALVREKKGGEIPEPLKADVDILIPNTSLVKENIVALVIGNEQYERVSKVPYANNDAKIFAEYCRKTLGIPDKNVRMYENATYGTIIGAMSDLQKIAKAFNGDINVVFYYAGHGIPNESTGDAYLLPVDADGMNTEVCYSLSRLYKELGGLGVQRTIVFMDACFSGAERGNGMVVAARGVVIKPKTNLPTGNTIVFSAATGKQAAYPYEEKGHGLFTYYLLKKLHDTKGDVTLGELGTYICNEAAKQAVLNNGKEQTPVVLTPIGMGDEWKKWKLKE